MARAAGAPARGHSSVDEQVNSLSEESRAGRARHGGEVASSAGPTHVRATGLLVGRLTAAGASVVFKTEGGVEAAALIGPLTLTGGCGLIVASALLRPLLFGALAVGPWVPMARYEPSTLIGPLKLIGSSALTTQSGSLSALIGPLTTRQLVGPSSALIGALALVGPLKLLGALALVTPLAPSLTSQKGLDRRTGFPRLSKLLSVSAPPSGEASASLEPAPASALLEPTLGLQKPASVLAAGVHARQSVGDGA